MTPAARVALNTAAQYVRTILNVIVGLFVTRVVLASLGQNDFGIYSLVSGIVGILGFITGSTSVATQRFLSYHQTNSPPRELQRVFSNSLLLHAALAIVVLIILEITGLFIFDGWLNIAPQRLAAAKTVFHIATAMIILSFLSAPFSAVLIAHENLVYSSVVSVVSSLLKLAIALLLLRVHSDRLVAYALMMLGISIFEFLTYYIYAILKYPESQHPRLRHFSKAIIAEMGRFTGWTVYGMACTIGRTQGLAIIINRTLSTSANAAFGIAFQVFGGILFVANSLMSAMAPQIFKAEGAGSRQSMLRLACSASKFCFLLLAAATIPLLFYIRPILQLWLGDVPEYTVFFCRVMLVAGLCDYITFGLHYAAQAAGNIKAYNLIVYTIKFAVVPVMVVMLWLGFDIRTAFWSYALLELASSLARILVLNKIAGLSITGFMGDVTGRSVVPFIFLTAGIYFSAMLPSLLWQLTAIAIIEVLYIGFAWLCSLNRTEKSAVKSVLEGMRN